MMEIEVEEMDDKKRMGGGRLEEEGIVFAVPKKIFYNTAMRFCRSISSLAVGAIEEPLEVVDAFCASGIRGIRYAKENKNVNKLTFIDIEKTAITAAKKNAKANKVKAKVSADARNISLAAFDNDADFLEIDPFGTPSPYLADAMRFFNSRKVAYLSVTATDVAVLCGGKLAASMKNYQAKPLNCSFTHEIGLRIMLRRIVDVAAEFNMGIEPLISFSDQHYLKAILKMRRGAQEAFDCQSQAGFISFCKKCAWRAASKFPVQKCGSCGAETDWAGPLWLGELHDKCFVTLMRSINNQRGYADKAKLSNFLSLMEGEVGMPPYYYNIHELCKIHHIQPVPRFDDYIKALTALGFTARRTHFSPICIKTDAPFRSVLEALGWKG
jgi:tRNA (guanine26-N2/guanine27-N2)-dimethyltransferase